MFRYLCACPQLLQLTSPNGAPDSRRPAVTVGPHSLRLCLRPTRGERRHPQILHYGLDLLRRGFVVALKVPQVALPDLGCFSALDSSGAGATVDKHRKRGSTRLMSIEGPSPLHPISH
jgi:hypothetical protein